MREIESSSVAENPPPILQNAFLPYLLKAVLGFGAIFVFSRFIDSLGVWLFYSLSLIFAVPITIRLAYFRAIRRTHNLSVFDSNSWMRRFLSGVVLRLIVSLMIGMVLAFVAVFRLRALDWQEWVTCAVAIPVFGMMVHCLTPVLDRQLAPLFRVAVSLKWASWLTIPVLLLIYWVLIEVFPDPLATEFAPWKGQGSTSGITSATVRELAAFHEGWRKLEAFVLGQVSDFTEWGPRVAVIIFVLGNAAFFLSCVSMLTCLYIPRSEIPRAFCRPTTQDEPPTPSLAGIAWGSAIFMILTICFFQTAAIIEGNLKQRPEERRPVKSFVKKVERIGNQFYSPGTIQKLQDAEADWQTSQQENVDILEREINRAFDRMKGNVEVFLDWYYSLPAEYVRIAKLLTGGFEAYLSEQLSSTLNRGKPFEEVAKIFSRKSEFKTELDRILSENSILVDDPGNVFVTDEIEDLNALSLNPPGVFDIAHRRFKERGFLATTAGVTGAGVGVKAGGIVTKKVMTQGVIKMAANAIAKVVIPKVAVGGLGAIAGGVVGSFVPIAGTFAGAAVGGSIGAIVVGVSVDKMLLELQEYMNRNEFRDALIEELNRERQKMLNAVKPSVSGGRENQPPSSPKTGT